MTPFSWTDENVERLKVLLAERLSASQVGIKLGVSRYAVFGKARRLGIPLGNPPCLKKPSKPKPIRNGGAIISGLRSRAQERSPRKRRIVATPPELPANEATHLPQELEAKPVSLFDLREESCRWPISDADDNTIGFCGAPKRDETVPYCSIHCRRAFLRGLNLRRP